MRFRKYSRKHVFLIIFQWDFRNEDIQKIAKEYWEYLKEMDIEAKKLAEEILKEIKKENINDFSYLVEGYFKKVQSYSDEEILAERLRRYILAVASILKQYEYFRQFYLTMLEYFGDKDRRRKLKALEFLMKIKKNLRELENYNKKDRVITPFREYVENLLKEKFPQNVEELEKVLKNFNALFVNSMEYFLKKAQAFSEKRVNQDMGEIREYADKILNQFIEHQTEIDAIIEEFLNKWTLDSLGSVERNLLRTGTAELVFVGVPDAGRAFNDYIDFSKDYAGIKASKFVNGVLSAIYNSRGLKV